VSEQASEQVSEQASEQVSEQASEQVSEQASEQVHTCFHDWLSSTIDSISSEHNTGIKYPKLPRFLTCQQHRFPVPVAETDSTAQPKTQVRQVRNEGFIQD